MASSNYRSADHAKRHAPRGKHAEYTDPDLNVKAFLHLSVIRRSQRNVLAMMQPQPERYVSTEEEKTNDDLIAQLMRFGLNDRIEGGIYPAEYYDFPSDLMEDEDSAWEAGLEAIENFNWTTSYPESQSEATSQNLPQIMITSEPMRCDSQLEGGDNGSPTFMGHAVTSSVARLGEQDMEQTSHQIIVHGKFIAPDIPVDGGKDAAVPKIIITQPPSVDTVSLLLADKQDSAPKLPQEQTEVFPVFKKRKTESLQPLATAPAETSQTLQTVLVADASLRAHGVGSTDKNTISSPSDLQGPPKPTRSRVVYNTLNWGLPKAPVVANEDETSQSASNTNGINPSAEIQPPVNGNLHGNLSSLLSTSPLAVEDVRSTMPEEDRHLPLLPSLEEAATGAPASSIGTAQNAEVPRSAQMGFDMGGTGYPSYPWNKTFRSQQQQLELPRLPFGAGPFNIGSVGAGHGAGIETHRMTQAFSANALSGAGGLSLSEGQQAEGNEAPGSTEIQPENASLELPLQSASRDFSIAAPNPLVSGSTIPSSNEKKHPQATSNKKAIDDINEAAELILGESSSEHDAATKKRTRETLLTQTPGLSIPNTPNSAHFTPGSNKFLSPKSGQKHPRAMSSRKIRRTESEVADSESDGLSSEHESPVKKKLKENPPAKGPVKSYGSEVPAATPNGQAAPKAAVQPKQPLTSQASGYEPSEPSSGGDTPSVEKLKESAPTQTHVKLYDFKAISKSQATAKSAAQPEQQEVMKQTSGHKETAVQKSSLHTGDQNHDGDGDANQNTPSTTNHAPAAVIRPPHPAETTYGKRTTRAEAAVSSQRSSSSHTSTPREQTPVEDIFIDASPAELPSNKASPAAKSSGTAGSKKPKPVAPKPKATPAKATVLKTTATPAKSAAPVKATPAKTSAAKATPVNTAAPAKATASKATPAKSAASAKTTPATATAPTKTLAKPTPAKHTAQKPTPTKNKFGFKRRSLPTTSTTSFAPRKPKTSLTDLVSGWNGVEREGETVGADGEEGVRTRGKRAREEVERDISRRLRGAKGRMSGTPGAAGAAGAAGSGK